ncbi:MAG: FAD-dependent monooxygenase [Burkholderiales bacterium]
MAGAELPVAIIGAGPIGLTTALGLAFHRIPFVVFEDDERLSLDTKAGTTLTRTLEVFERYGVADAVLAQAVRVDEIGEIDRATNRSTLSVRLDALDAETRYPFVINLPQDRMEPVLAAALAGSPYGKVQLGHRLTRYENRGDHVHLWLDTPDGAREIDARYLLACDGGRSTVREQMGVTVEGKSFPERYVLVDLEADLDIANPRDYPYLAYFGDPTEWMILVRQPHCWRFLFPLADGHAEPTADELRDKVLQFIGDVKDVRVLGMNVYRVHHRVASRWRDERVFLMGDAAHLITPMWALGLNTGVLDASNLPWRLAWVLRGWAPESLLDGYEREQKPLAVDGSRLMAEAARENMARRAERVTAMTDNNWGNAYTRSLLGVRMDVNGSGAGGMVKTATEPPIEVGDRMPNVRLHDAHGRECRLHDLTRDRFAALYLTDARRKPPLPASDSRGLAHYIVSRWDAPHDSGQRDRALLDPGGRFAKRLGVPPDSIVLVRPDEHVAAIAPMTADAALRLYHKAIGKP